LRLLHKKVVILRESGVSSTLRLFDFIAGVSGILSSSAFADDDSRGVCR